MPSIAGIVAVLAAILLIRSAVRSWNRRIEAALEIRLRPARELATRIRAERETAERESRVDAFRIVAETGRAGCDP